MVCTANSTLCGGLCTGHRYITRSDMKNLRIYGGDLHEYRWWFSPLERNLLPVSGPWPGNWNRNIMRIIGTNALHNLADHPGNYPLPGIMPSCGWALGDYPSFVGPAPFCGNKGNHTSLRGDVFPPEDYFLSGTIPSCSGRILRAARPSGSGHFFLRRQRAHKHK